MRKVFTVGYGGRRFERILQILKENQIEVLVDVRRFPISKQAEFCQVELKRKLRENKIDYAWIEQLGGFRKGGYQEYAKTKQFKEGLEKLVSIAKSKLVALLCREISHLSCHRRYISDFLLKRGFKVVHLK